MRLVTLASCCVLGIAAAACGDIDVKFVRATETVPADLEGVWNGSWQSEHDNTAGLLSIQLQEWKGEAIVSVAIDNPCFVPGDYELSIAGTRIELRSAGTPFFTAVLGPDRTLTGTYLCHEDSGSWSAAWVSALPPIVDLSGAWLGSVSTPQQPDQVLLLELMQSVRRGTLALDGLLRLPNLVPTPLLMTGGVVFHDGVFDLMLATVEGSNPSLVLTGFGVTEPLQVQLGVFSVLAADPPLPFAQGVWRVEWQWR